MKECTCKDWKENAGTLESAVILAANHGLKGLKKSFTYCPYCRHYLKEIVASIGNPSGVNHE